MTELMLLRMQFGVSIGIHYLFPIATFGLTLFILIFETLYLIKRQEPYRALSVFLVKMLGMIFVAGVATGLMMPFALGANWSRFSEFAGALLGAVLAVEAVTAFALESAFIAILLFGRDRVSPFVYWLSAVLVFIGAHLSGFWIIAANSWMQTPAGYAIEDGRVILTSISQALFNHSTLIRFAHAVTAAWLVGAFLVAGVAAYYLARARHEAFARKLLAFALPIALAMAVAQPVIGHFHILQVGEYNPEKAAAYEGVFKTVKGAPLLGFGIPDEKNQVIHFAIGMPYMLSFLETGDLMGEVKGLEEYPRENWPPVNVVFATFHLMVMLGMMMMGVSALGVFLLWRKKLYQARWFLLVLPWLIPIPFLANELGWIGAEIGRQPWIIYGVMKTVDGATITLPMWQLTVSFIGITLVYLAITVLTFVAVRNYVIKGPK